MTVAKPKAELQKIASAAVHEYFTTAEVAERFRTTESTVRYWRFIGKGPASVKPGRRVLYPVDQVEAYEAELRREAGGDA
jgi:hypothetical protein